MAYPGNEGCFAQQQQPALFVAKTYEMVSNPRTDSLIRWGKSHNSFLVLDPAHFSQSLLPFYFKHCNFSSFIRQLNTYGFRKVDPDIWEFAHESFLRGQTHLLPLIVRRRKKGSATLAGLSGCSSLKREGGGEGSVEEEEEELIMKKLDKLKRQQRALEEEIEGMSKRLRSTERKPSQMMSFLVKIAEDPDLLGRFTGSRNELPGAGEKRKSLAPNSPASAPSLASSPLDTVSKAAAVSNEEEAIARLWGNATENIRAGGDCEGSELLQADLNCQTLCKTDLVSPAASLPSGNIDFPFCLLGRGFFY